MNLRALHNQKHTAVLTAGDMARIRRNARPPSPDNSIELEHTRMASVHERTLKATETWGNSVVNERQARITRMERLAQEHEEEMRKVDAEEKQVQKAKRRELLGQAELTAFQDKPEIRAVNAQLKLHEATRERQRQVLMKERRNEIERQREEAWHEQEKARLKAAEEREQELAQQRRQKAMDTAEGFKRQRLEAEERRIEQHQIEVEEEELLAAEARRQLEAEQMREIDRTTREFRNIKEAKESNATLIAWKARMRAIEQAEDDRIREDKIKLDDDIDRRKEADAKRRADRQAVVDKVIEQQQVTLREIQSKQQHFDDSQYELQYEKERKAMEELRVKQERMRDERQRDFKDATAKIEAKKRMVKKKATFPVDEVTERSINQGGQLEIEKMRGLRDLADFQRQQAAEKKERDAAERERVRLEFQRGIDLENQRTVEAQEYAREMLLAARQQRRRK